MKRSDPKNEYKHQRMRLVRAKAKELMLSGENHLCLIFSLIIICVTAIIPWLLYGLVYYEVVFPLPEIALALAEIILVFPLLYGLLHITKDMAEGKKNDFRELFCAFSSSEGFFRSIALGIVIALMTAASVLLVALPVAISDWMITLGVPQVLATLECVVGIAGVCVLLALLCCRMSLFPMLVAGGAGVFSAIARSFALTRGKTFKLLRFAIGFLPLVLVSVVAVFVPMLIYTAPYMLCAYAIGVKTICENNE